MTVVFMFKIFVKPYPQMLEQRVTRRTAFHPPKCAKKEKKQVNISQNSISSTLNIRRNIFIYASSVLVIMNKNA